MNVLNRDQVQKLTDLRAKFGVRTNVGCVSCEEDSSACAVPGSEDPGAAAGAEDLVKTITDAVMQKLNLRA
jgi:hypothetical protein